VNGQASYDMPTDLEAGETYKVTARYNGRRLYKASQDAEYVTVRNDEVAGSDESRGDNGGSGGDNGGSANRSGPSEGEVMGAEGNDGMLPSVGSDATTQIAALAGLGLLGAGVALMLYRRRVRG
jgi:LPXTG-motif cell wall-anchored protein